LRGCRNGKQNKVIDFALFFGFHPLIGIEAIIGAIPSGDLTANLTGEIINLKALNPARRTLTSKKARPCGFYAIGQR
jgi:hypothetical protein